MRARLLAVVAVLACARGPEPAAAPGPSAARGERAALAAVVVGAAPEAPPETARARFVAGGVATPQARLLAAALASAADVGLEPADYAGPAWRERIRALDARRAAPEETDRFDADLRTAAVRFAGDLRRGRVDPQALGYPLPAEPFDAEAFADRLATADDPQALLDGLAPRLEAYDRLVHALPRLRLLAALRRGEPPLRAAERPVRPGARCADSARLADLLAALGDLDEAERDAASAPLVSPELAGALRRFQERHGLAADGVLGPRTAAALAVPLDARVRQVELALERWRWTPRDLGPRWITVNVPAQRLEAGEVDPPTVELAMDVIVGASEEARRTPVLAARVDGIVFSPYWDVPPRIAAEELAPRLARHAGLAEGDGYFVEVPSARLPVGPTTLALVRAGEARLRQRPGPRNTLGPMKLVMPNPAGVYLHGTATPALFARSARTLSHGCIRVADPAALAAFLLAGQPEWDAERVAAAMVRAEPLQASLARRAHVLLVYATATADGDGKLRFWPDVYGEDARLDALLRPPPPPPALPGARPAGVDVDEVGRGVEPDPAAPEPEGEVAQRPRRDAGEAQVEGAPLEVEAVAGDAGAALPEERVRRR